MSPTLRLIHRILAGDQRGMAFIEFAMVVPLMLVLLLGSVLGTELMLAYMKVNDAAEVAVDLITQCSNGVSGGGAPGGTPTPNATTGDLQNFANAALGVIYPLNTGNMTIAFASVTWNSAGTITGPSGGADWVWPTGTTLFSTSAVAQVQAAGLIQGGLAGSTVVVNTSYVYNLPFTFKIPMLGGASAQPFTPTYTFTANGFSFPRYVSKIVLQTTIPNPNPPATNPDLYCP